jgi:hypothetical protein
MTASVYLSTVNERYGDLDEAAGAADACACSWGGFFARIKISSPRSTMDGNIRIVLNTWAQERLAFWRGSGDEMAKRPLKTHTIYL